MTWFTWRGHRRTNFFSCNQLCYFEVKQDKCISFILASRNLDKTNFNLPLKKLILGSTRDTNFWGVILPVVGLIYTKLFMINACLRLVACSKVAWSKSARDNSALNSHLIGLELSEISFLILSTMLGIELVYSLKTVMWTVFSVMSFLWTRNLEQVKLTLMLQ